MTHDEKTIILCAFRYAVYSDLEDSAPIIEFIGKNLDDYDVSDMETLLDDVHFSLQFLKNAGRREITHIRAFGNRLKRTIKEREKADGVFPKPRTTRTPTFFIGDTGFSRFLIVMAFAYAAPRHSYMFGLLQGITRPYIENFTEFRRESPRLQTWDERRVSRVCASNRSGTIKPGYSGALLK